MSDYVALPTRTAADVNSAADVNQLQTNIKATRDEWIGTVYATTADYTITDTDGYGKIFVNPTSGDKTITLPTLAANQNRVISVVVTNAGGKVTIDGEGAETINGASSIYLQGQYDRIIVIAQSSEWSILSLCATYDTGWINCSDWTARDLGTSAFDYDNRSSAGADHFIVGETITEAGSGNTGIIQSDTDAASSGTIYVKNVTGTGIWTNNAVITGGTSGTTADVNEAAGSNKNQDTNVFHELPTNVFTKTMRLYVSSDKTDPWEISLGAHDISTSDYGVTNYLTDTSNNTLSTANSGFQYISGAGESVTLDTEDWYYKIIIEVFI